MSAKSASKRHANIPIFIPHEGCPNDCVFCNQRKITGTDSPADRDIRPEIESVLSTLDPEIFDAEIAFFGGSFTGIDRCVMEKLLSTAYEYVKDGRVSSIRLSTRPDYIDEEILEVLARYGVRHIELGIQSADNAVLSASRRGHTANDTVRACREITKRGFVLGGQMMIGLPGSTPESEMKTAEMICSLGASEARIYPTVVFRGTELCRMAQCGEYKPLSNDEAADRAAACYGVFLRGGVKVLRVGLQSSESLSDPDEVFTGASHPAMGEMCEGRVFRGLILQSLGDIIPAWHGESTLVIQVPRGSASKAAGHKKENKRAIEEFLSQRGITIKKIKIAETDVNGGNFRVNTRFSD